MTSAALARMGRDYGRQVAKLSVAGQHFLEVVHLYGVEMVPSDFDSWYRAEHPRLVAALVGLSREPDLGRELADEAFARIVSRFRLLNSVSDPSAWVFRVGLNLLRDTMRRRSIERRVFRKYVERSDCGNPDFDFTVWDLVAHLSQRQREVVALRYAADLKESDIARAMRISRGTVSSLLSEARVNLRRMVDAAETEESFHD